VPAALPATALLHVSVGDTLRLRDRLTGTLVTFTITGLFAERQLSGPVSSYWGLNTVPAAGTVTAAGPRAGGAAGAARGWSPRRPHAWPRSAGSPSSASRGRKPGRA
jgi:hypothetical protein